MDQYNEQFRRRSAGCGEGVGANCVSQKRGPTASFDFNAATRRADLRTTGEWRVAPANLPRPDHAGEIDHFPVVAERQGVLRPIPMRETGADRSNALPVRRPTHGDRRLGESWFGK